MAIEKIENRLKTKKKTEELELQIQNEIEYISHVISVRRVSKTVEGGRRLRFSALVVVGNGDGLVSFAFGSASEVAQAVLKATNKAKKNLQYTKKININQNRTIYHDILHKFKAAELKLRYAKQGTGLKASNTVRAVLEAAGIKDIVAKCIRSSNPTVLVECTIQALQRCESNFNIKHRRGV